jgi:hypothetical protein
MSIKATAGKQKKKAEELAELKRELTSLNVSLSILGTKSEASRELVARHASILDKIKELENQDRDKTVL